MEIKFLKITDEAWKDWNHRNHRFLKEIQGVVEKIDPTAEVVFDMTEFERKTDLRILFNSASKCLSGDGDIVVQLTPKRGEQIYPFNVSLCEELNISLDFLFKIIWKDVSGVEVRIREKEWVGLNGKSNNSS